MKKDLYQGKIPHADKITCSGCGELLNGFTGESKKPKDGDYSICSYCGVIGEYAEGVTKIVPLTEAQLKELSPEIKKNLNEAAKIIREFQALQAFKKSFKQNFN